MSKKISNFKMPTRKDIIESNAHEILSNPTKIRETLERTFDLAYIQGQMNIIEYSKNEVLDIIDQVRKIRES